MRIKNIFLYNQWIKEEIEGDKKNLDRNGKKKTQNTKTAKVVLTRMLIITHIKEKKILHKKTPIFTPQGTRKTRTN